MSAIWALAAVVCVWLVTEAFNNYVEKKYECQDVKDELADIKSKTDQQKLSKLF